MLADLQKVAEQAPQLPWIATSAGYALFGMLTTAIAALFAYGKVIFDKLHVSLNQTIDQQKAQILMLEAQVKSLTETKSAHAAELILQARIEAQERQLDHARDEQVEATEKRFREMLDQNVKIITAIHESTEAVKVAAEGDADVTDALKALDLDIQTCLRIQEDLRRKLDSMYCSKEPRGK
jgi:hypothetical protein